MKFFIYMLKAAHSLYQSALRFVVRGIKTHVETVKDENELYRMADSLIAIVLLALCYFCPTTAACAVLFSGMLMFSACVAVYSIQAVDFICNLLFNWPMIGDPFEGLPV